jgi:thioredoxin 1
MRKKRIIFLGSLFLAFAIFQGLSSYEFRRNVFRLTHALVGKGDEAEKKQRSIPSAGTLPALVDVGAKECAPCKKMAPVLDDLTEEYAGLLRVEFIDVRKDKDAEATYRVRVIPTQIFYGSSGKELKRHYGYMSKKEILQTFRDIGFDLEKTRETKS